MYAGYALNSFVGALSAQVYTNRCSTKQVICCVYLFRYSKEKTANNPKEIWQKSDRRIPMLAHKHTMGSSYCQVTAGHPLLRRCAGDSQ